MSADDKTSRVADMRFAVDLRRQFESVGENVADSPKRHGWMMIAGGVTAVIVTAAAILLLGRPNPGPERKVAVASPTATARPTTKSAKSEPTGGRLGPASLPDVTMISAVTIDGAGRPWLTGSRALEQPFVAYLEGGQWVQIPPPAGAKTLGPATVLSADDLWAPVTRGFAHWDGAAWQKTSVPWLDGDIFGIADMAALSTSDIWAVGRQEGELYKTPGDGPGEHTVGYRPLTMHWDGAGWVQVNVPAMPGRTSTLEAVATSGSETWAVGSYEQKTGEQAQQGQGSLPMELTRDGPIALRWNGDRWIDMDVPSVGARGTALGDVLVLAANDVWVLGWTFHGDESASHDETVSTYVAHWDGASWEQIKTPHGDGLGSFWSLAGTSDEDIWLGGNGSGGIGYAETAHWDGARWVIYAPVTFGENSGSTVGTGMPQITSSSAMDVWFDAGFTRSWDDGSRPADPVLYHWEGQSWTKVVVPF